MGAQNFSVVSQWPPPKNGGFCAPNFALLEEFPDGPKFTGGGSCPPPATTPLQGCAPVNSVSHLLLLLLVLLFFTSEISRFVILSSVICQSWRCCGSRAHFTLHCWKIIGRQRLTNMMSDIHTPDFPAQYMDRRTRCT